MGPLRLLPNTFWTAVIVINGKENIAAAPWCDSLMLMFNV